MRYLILAFICLPFAACESTPVTLESMSEEELFVHNLERPLMEKIYCTREAATSTFIRKRRCMSVADWVDDNLDSYLRLEVLNTPGSTVILGLD